MPSVTIDAGVLAAPSEEATPAQVTEYVETLLDWQRLLDERWISIHMSERANEALDDDGLYPLHDHLQRLFAAHGIVEFTVNDVVQVAHSLLQLTPTFEDVFLLKDVLAQKFTTAPDLLLATDVPPHLAADLERCIILTSVLRNYCEDFTTEHFLIVRPHSGVGEVQVEAVVEYLEHSRDDVEGIPAPPEYFRAQLSLSQSFRELLSAIDEVAVWESAETDDDAKRAVKLAVYKARIEEGLEPAWEDIPDFTFNKEFVESANKVFAANPRGLIGSSLRAMAETLDGRRLEDAHWLRTGSGGGNSQRTRGGDKAWRRDVTYEYHLHYWVREDGTIEFGSVGVHDDFDIPY